MSEWWSYRLSDFLLFSPRAYWRLFELQNEAFWPLPVVTPALGLALLALVFLQTPYRGRLIPLALGIPWAFVGGSFLWERYAAINWAAAYVAPLFALEALFFFVIGVPGRLPCDRQGMRRVAGILLIALALAYPLTAPLFGRPWQAAEIFGMAPDPTASATLGFLLLARGGSVWLLCPIPLLWCLASGLTLYAMDDPQAWVPFAAALLSAVAVTPVLGTARDRPLRAAGPRSKSPE